MISKELVSEVLGVKILDVEIHNNSLITMLTEDDSSFINLYEFIHKNCKEWAYKKGFSIQSRFYTDVCFGCELFDVVWSPSKDRMPCTGSNNSEIDCIIKACEWIKEQKDKK